MPAYPDFEPIGVHTTVTAGAAAASINVPARANAVLIASSANNAMVTVEGTTPTGSIGFQLVADAAPVLLPLNKRNSILKHIREAGSNATVQYLFVKVHQRNWL